MLVLGSGLPPSPPFGISISFRGGHWKNCYRKAEVIRRHGPWMDLWMAKGIRNIPLHKTWTKYHIDKDWCKVSKGEAGPPGLRAGGSVQGFAHPRRRLKGSSKECMMTFVPTWLPVSVVFVLFHF